MDLYYIVSNTKLPDILSPEIPKFYKDMPRECRLEYTRNNFWGDMKTPRISLFTSIDAAIQGSFLYRAQYVAPENASWYVYSVFMVQQDKVRKPSKEEEPCVQLIPISWYTGNAKLKYLGTIQPSRIDDGNQKGFVLTDKNVYSDNAPTMYISKYRWEWLQRA